MEDPSPSPGRNTPSSKAPQLGPPPPGSQGPPPPHHSAMPPSTMASSHGAQVRPYGYPGHQMHPNAPYGPGPQSNHPGMGHHPYGPYGPPNHQMHPGQQQQQQQPQHGGQYMPPMMMPPPSQYPNSKAGNMPPQPPPGSPGANPHHPMMPQDRSSMPQYGYGQRFAGPPPPHHGASPNSPHPSQNPYYMRPQQPGGKNFYPNAGPYGPPPGQGSGAMMMPGQHPHQQMMPHHPSMGPQMQQHVGYGGGHPMSEMISSSAPSIPTHTLSSSSNGGNDNLRHPAPPSIMDELGQTSTTSSQAADDSCGPTDMQPTSHKTSGNKHHLSHPSTPNASNMGSPGAASMGSFHDEFDSVSSPSWPRTPASPALSSQFSTESHSHGSSKRNDVIQKLYEMSDEPDRRLFLDKYLQHQEERGSPLTQVPTISKIPLDLYRLYISVKERGGFVEVTRTKTWKECAQICNIANSSSAAYTLRKQYTKHLLPFECKYDRGGIEPGPLLAGLEAANTSKKKTANSSSKASSNPSTPSSTPRLSPSDSQSGHSYPMPPSGPHHPGGPYEGEPQPGGYPPYGHPQQSQYYHPEYGYGPPQHGPPPGHMPPPPPPPSQAQTSQSTQPSSESVKVKDPFDDDNNSSMSANYQNARQQGPYYGPPTPQHHSVPPNSYGPETNVPQPHYPPGPPEGGQYSRIPPPPPTGPASESAPNAYPGYGPTQRNGPSSHPGYYGPGHPNSRPHEPYGHQMHPSQQGQHRYPVPPGSQPPPNSAPNFGPRTAQGGVPSAYSQQAQQPPTQSNQYGNSQDPKYSDALNAAPRMQSPLAQRLLAAKEPPPPQPNPPPHQNYPPQPSMYPNSAGSGASSHPAPPTTPTKPPATSGGHHPPTPNSPSSYPPMQQHANSNISWMSSPVTPTPHRYGQPKRHPDFVKPNQENRDQYASFPPYQNFPGASSGPRPQMSPSAPSGPPGQWAREGGSPYRMGAPNQFGQYSGHAANRDPAWHDGRSPSVPPTSSGESPSPNWPPSNRYPGYPQSMHEFNGPHYSQHSGNKMTGFNRNDPINQQSLYMSHPKPGQEGQHGGRRPYQPPSMPPLYLASGQQSMMASQAKREIQFPPDSVEATVPTSSKKRRLTARDITPVDAWHLFMALKSGLLAESSYALDVLNIYSNDDSTLFYLGLPNMPGLLEVLLEHFKCYLNEMFENLFDDTEIGYEAKQLRGEIEQKFGSSKRAKKVKWYELPIDCEDDEASNAHPDDEDFPEEQQEVTEGEGKEALNGFLEKHFKCGNPQQVVLSNATNYTHVTRTGKPVIFQHSKSLFISDYGKAWDQMKNGIGEIGYEHWQKGCGETTSHIQSHMEPKENYLRIVRVMRDKAKESESAQQQNGFADKEVENKDGDEGLDKQHQLLESENEHPDGVEEEYPKVRDSDRERYLKRRHEPDYEEESYDQDEPTVCIGRDYQESIKSRCFTVSNLIRNLTFVPGNDVEMCKHPGLLLVLSRLILLHHEHAIKREKKKKSTATKQGTTTSFADLKCSLEDEDSALFNTNCDEKEKEKADEEQPLTEKEWWWESLHILRENTLVTLANLSGQMDLTPFAEQISLTLLDGLLHWAVCPSSYAQDALPAAHASLSPRSLAYETLSKLSIYESNVDLILATPPWSRLAKLISNLSRSLGRHEEPPIREFAVVLLSNFSAAEPATARAIALTGHTIPLLLGFIEQAEQGALHVANQQGFGAVRDNPDLALGTTLDMIRRAASTLRNMTRIPENRPLFVQYEQRLLALVMSQIMDHNVATIMADILYETASVSAKKALLLGDKGAQYHRNTNAEEQQKQQQQQQSSAVEKSQEQTENGSDNTETKQPETETSKVDNPETTDKTSDCPSESTKEEQKNSTDSSSSESSSSTEPPQPSETDKPATESFNESKEITNNTEHPQSNGLNADQKSTASPAPNHHSDVEAAPEKIPTTEQSAPPTTDTRTVSNGILSNYPNEHNQHRKENSNFDHHQHDSFGVNKPGFVPNSFMYGPDSEDYYGKKSLPLLSNEVTKQMNHHQHHHPYYPSSQYLSGTQEAQGGNNKSISSNGLLTPNSNDAREHNNSNNSGGVGKPIDGTATDKKLVNELNNSSGGGAGQNSNVVPPPTAVQIEGSTS